MGTAQQEADDSLQDLYSWGIFPHLTTLLFENLHVDI